MHAVCVLTQCNLRQVQTVDPGNLTKGVGSVEDHHETNGPPGPTGEQTRTHKHKGSGCMHIPIDMFVENKAHIQTQCTICMN